MAHDPTLAPEAFLAALPDGRPLLGLDLGSRTIGLALSDIRRTIASPLETIIRTRFAADASALETVVARHDIAGLVIGLPLNMDGSEGPRVQSTRAFTRNIAPRIPLPMLLWDERLSTAAVERTLIAADRSRRRRAELVDKLAAAYILQAALDRLSNLAARPDGQ
ncbi:MAG: Holliday junction resolvase RuvX [Rhizobiales bacterium]|nr:Holliday junction resolvase RuvX [Hyphomicrobiales bacterium]